MNKVNYTNFLKKSPILGKNVCFKALFRVQIKKGFNMELDFA